MAWDALGSIFNKKDKEKVDKPGMMGGTSGPSAPTQSNAPWTNGLGGSSAAPASAGFVNFGTLYDLNKDKAGGMAAGVFGKAQSEIEKAKGKLQGAKDTFNQKREAGAGTWKPIGGAHGTRIENKTTQSADLSGVEGEYGWEGPTRYGWNAVGANRGVISAKGTPQSVQGSKQQGMTGQSTRDLVDSAQRSTAPGATSAGAYRNEALGFGPIETLLYEQPDREGLKDYHHSVSELEAKSGAGQGYTGPDSLKDAIGDEEYAQLAKDLQDAEDNAANLTNAGGISTALGYEPFQDTGKSNLDTALTQVAGQENFKKLADQTKGLKGQLGAAQADSMKTAKAQEIQSDAAAKEWQDLLDEYEKANAQDPNAPIIIGNANAGPTGFAANEGGQFGPGGGVLNEKESKAGANWIPNTSAAGYQEVASAGYSQQEIVDIWDSLSQDERDALTSTESVSGVLTGSNKDRAAAIQSILAKLAAARAAKKG